MIKIKKQNKLCRLLILLLICIYVDANSQTTKFGFSIGVNSANTLPSKSGYLFIDNPVIYSGIGFSIGVFADIPLKHNFYFQPTLSFVTKQSSTTSAFLNSSIVKKNGELNLNYLYRPFKKSGFLVGGGPSFSVGSAMNKLTIQNFDFIYKSSSTMFNLDFGVNILAKYEFNSHLAITSNYNVGLQNTDRMQYFGFNILYKF